MKKVSREHIGSVFNDSGQDYQTVADTMGVNGEGNYETIFGGRSGASLYAAATRDREVEGLGGDLHPIISSSCIDRT